MSECINHMPEQYQHIVISLTEITPFAKKNLNIPVHLIALKKSKGQDYSLYLKLYKLFRQLSPDILHTYNLSTLEYQVIAAFAGIKKRIHAEHGRDINDPEGINKKYNFLRRLVNPFLHHWVVVSKDLKNWLINIVKLPPQKIQLIYNGVDTEHFKKLTKTKKKYQNKSVIGTIGRFDPIKNQKILIPVFKEIQSKQPELARTLMFIIVGDGNEYENLKKSIEDENLQQFFYLPGMLYNIVEILADFDIFILPSIAEGLPMTLLEAMSMGLPSVCTKVGGVPEVLTKETGILVEPESRNEIVTALLKLLNDKQLSNQLGVNARQEVIKKLSIQTMVDQYIKLYKN